MDPVVSVIITTYNHEKYIGQTLESVFSQTYKEYEVIVVDDGSTDDTPNRIAPFKDSIHYIRQKNQGVASSRNSGIRVAKGHLLAFLDGDDLWYPEKLSVQVETAQRYPGSGMIVVDGIEFSGNEILQPTLFKLCFDDLVDGSVMTGRCYYQLLCKNFILTTSQVMVPAEVLGRIGLSNKRFKGASDYDLYIRIAMKYEMTIIKKCLIRWRYLSTSVSGDRETRNLRYLPENIAILKNHLREAHEEDRPFIRQLRERKLSMAAENLYYYGRTFDRIWATKNLLRLFFVSLHSMIVASFLIGLWLPSNITTKIGLTVRKIIRQRPLNSQSSTAEKIA
jgi:glycosyltransferase involved in cell wall biosynthesis